MRDLKVAHRRIEICGGIASGKTTLAHLLADALEDDLILEDFRSNRFWRLAYEDPDRFTIEKNISFLLEHAASIKASRAQAVVCDFAVVQDLAYAHLESSDHLDVMRSLYRHLYLPLPPVSLIIYLKCDAEIEIRRVQSRGRPEEQGITSRFLENLNDAIESVLSGPFVKAPLHTINSGEVDFANDRAERRLIKKELLSLIREAMPA